MWVLSGMSTKTLDGLDDAGGGGSGLATNVAGGGPKQVLVQNMLNSTTFIPAGVAGHVLTANAFLNPTFQPLGTSPLADDLGGGNINQIPYQVAPDQTSFIGGVGSNGFLRQNGVSIPTIVGDIGTGLVVRQTNPSLVTPTLGVATGTSINLAATNLTPMTATVSGNEPVVAALRQTGDKDVIVKFENVTQTAVSQVGQYSNFYQCDLFLKTFGSGQSIRIEPNGALCARFLPSQNLELFLSGLAPNNLLFLNAGSQVKGLAYGAATTVLTSRI